MPNFEVDDLISAPRTAGLALSPDGSRLVTTVAVPDAEGKKYVSSLWEIDPAGESGARRLTRSAAGESSPVFLPDGSLLFTSARPDPEAKASGDEPDSQLWLLPAGGGEAQLVATAPAGIRAIAVAADAGTIAVATASFPDAASPEDDAARAKSRKDAGVTAQLFEDYPIRYWDHYLGPRERRLVVADPPGPDGERVVLRDVSAGSGRSLDEVSFVMTPDGTEVISGWVVADAITERRVDLVAISTANGERRVLATLADADHDAGACSPDGRWVVCQREQHGTPEQSERVGLWLIDRTGTTEGRALAPDLDLWPQTPVWAPDSSSLFFTADERGHRPVFRLDLDGGSVTRLTAAGYHDSVCVAPDGATVYALQSTVASPPQAVALDSRAPDQQGRPLPTPGVPLEVPSRVEETEATAPDGTPIHSWLVLPAGASASAPAPMVVFFHGGPLGSWNTWHWRWNPHVLASRGYAVLLPDPALSTGYGQSFIDRGRGRWGEAPFVDVMAAVEEAAARPDIDGERVAAMGGSFGGYLANWTAGHTDRFRGIVTHASLWALEQFHGTTDMGVWWEREFGDPYADRSRYDANSPNQHVGSIRTPMLVIHGELDHRVPVSEALRLWTDLRRHGVPSRFLYFPDENHWVLKPANARLWYETVLAFLDEQLLGKEWARPSLL